MATTIARLNAEGQFPIATLDTYNYTINTTASHQVQVKLHNANYTSSVVITIKKNSTTLATLNTSPNINGEASLSVISMFASSDVVGVVVTSAAAADAALNVLTGHIRINITNVPD